MGREFGGELTTGPPKGPEKGRGLGIGDLCMRAVTGKEGKQDYALTIGGGGARVMREKGPL